LKIDQEYSYLISGKFVNAFGLLLKLSCSFTFGDINIIIVLMCMVIIKYKKSTYEKITYHTFYTSLSLQKDLKNPLAFQNVNKNLIETI